MNVPGPSNNISTATTLTKCEFCDITFKSDIDVSKHLVSTAHSRKRSEFSALNKPQDFAAEKQIPENFSETLKLLKVRSPEDLRILNDRNFFKMKSEDQAQIAEETAKILLIRFAQFEGKNTELGKGVSDLNRRPKVEKEGKRFKNPTAGTSRQAGPSISSKEIDKQRMPEVQRQQDLRTAQTQRQAYEEEQKAQQAIQRAEQEKNERKERKRQKEIQRQNELAKQLKEQQEKELERQKEEEAEKKRQKEAQIHRPKQPVPSMDFDRYKIDLAIIKVEPKDNDEESRK